MEDSELIVLSSLFDAIGIIEKGIERIYHYLLKNKRIENLKEVSSQYGLTLKRGYKVCAVLNELELVQIYDRPMKIHLASPVLPIWQKIINERILELEHQFQEKKQKAESTLDDFSKAFNLSQEIAQEYVEFINYDLNFFAETYSAFLTQSECKIATGIRYENDLISMVKSHGVDNIPKDIIGSLREGMNRIKNNLKNLDLQIIFNAELVEDLLESKEFKILSDHALNFNLEFKNIVVHVTHDDFSNFILTDKELIQPSFDPSNNLIGSYISRNSSIYKIFDEKFNELFAKGVKINQFIEEEGFKVNKLSEAHQFVLCFL
ncbi:MAG: hypothetical protein EU533_04030 [Promethearchaeota archaeon]|nr:MAG: hypothetical protein EU533_04030 [Candidatus Lokiarchaeota archaeon]